MMLMMTMQVISSITDLMLKTRYKFTLLPLNITLYTTFFFGIFSDFLVEYKDLYCSITCSLAPHLLKCLWLDDEWIERSTKNIN